jgi:hypothetical protein
MIEESDKYVVNIVYEDLKDLKKELSWDLSDDLLRKCSAVLRRLLVEGKYGQAWRILGLEKQPSIKALNLEESIKGIPIAEIDFTQAGGAINKGMRVMAAFKTKKMLTPLQIKEQGTRDPRSLIMGFWLSDFLKSPCIIIDGNSISRSDLIKYVANKLGGVHIDPRRDISKEKDKIYVILDQYRSQVQLAGKNAIYYELLSIGQSLIDSENTTRFMGAAELSGLISSCHIIGSRDVQSQASG